MIRSALAVTLVVSFLCAGSARADPISLSAYERSLADARAEVEVARGSSGDARGAAVRRALAQLPANAEVRVGAAVYPAVPHATIRALLEKGDAASLELASGMLDETLAAVRRGGLPASGSRDDARALLDAVLGAPDFRRAPPAPDWRTAVGDLLRELLVRLFPDLRAPSLSIELITLVIGGLALVLLAGVVTPTLRGLRAKVTREALRGADEPARGPLPADHLRAADEARRAGRLREATRELFLAALAGLEQRGAVRLDAALTDREVVARAAHLAARADLEALIVLYERAWYGMREPSLSDVERAGDLARRIAA